MRGLVAVPVLLAAVACGGGAPQPSAPIPGLRTFAEEPAHRHTTSRVTYDHTPPAGGRHWPSESGGVRGWLRCAVYDVPVPNEFAVHSEEHGAVWLTYQPGADPADLVRLARGNPYVLVSPYPGQAGRFMASTWGAQLAVERASDPRLRAFVTTFAGGDQGREQGADCAHGTEPGPARAALDRANH